MNKKIMVGMLVAGMVLTGCVSNNKTLENRSTKIDQAIESSTATHDTKATTVVSTGDTTNGLPTIKVTIDEAIQKYQETYPEKTITSIELEKSFGAYYYEIKGVDDTTEFSVKIQAETGELKKEREETLDRDEQNGVEKQNESLDLKEIQSLDQVSELAEKVVSGGEAVEWKIERELSITYWEVKVKNGRQEISVKINAQTQEVLEIDVDD